MMPLVTPPAMTMSQGRSAGVSGGSMGEAVGTLLAVMPGYPIPRSKFRPGIALQPRLAAGTSAYAESMLGRRPAVKHDRGVRSVIPLAIGPAFWLKYGEAVGEAPSARP